MQLLLTSFATVWTLTYVLLISSDVWEEGKRRLSSGPLPAVPCQAQVKQFAKENELCPQQEG